MKGGCLWMVVDGEHCEGWMCLVSVVKGDLLVCVHHACVTQSIITMLYDRGTVCYHTALSYVGGICHPHIHLWISSLTCIYVHVHVCAVSTEPL